MKRYTMKKKYLIVFIVGCFIFMNMLVGCSSKPSTNHSEVVSMRDNYRIEDFESIIIGESTFKDVYETVAAESMQVTSYGGFCEYPMQDGGCIRVKFYGKDLIVGAIEEVSAIQ